MPDLRAGALDAAIDEVAAAAARAGVVAIVGTERVTAAGREIVAVVLGADGAADRRAGQDPDRPLRGAALRARQRPPRVRPRRAPTFGIAICHEGFRYPEVSRSLARGGAQIVFAPHWVITDDGSLPTRWCDPANPYNEKALLCRALENTRLRRGLQLRRPRPGLGHLHHRPRRAWVAARVRRGRRRRRRRRARPRRPAAGTALGAGAQRGRRTRGVTPAPIGCGPRGRARASPRRRSRRARAWPPAGCASRPGRARGR